MDEQRIQWFDSLKFFAIFLVLWGHTIQHLLAADRLDSPMFMFITSFHMPLFMAISGFFAPRMARLDWKSMLKTRSRQILLPLLVADVVMAIICLFLGSKIQIMQTFWFLWSVFICSVLYYIATRAGKFFWLVLIVFLLAVQLTSAFKLNLMFPSFVAGVLINRYFDLFKKYSQGIFAVSALIFTLLQIGWDKSFLSVDLHAMHRDLSLGDFASNFIYLRGYTLAIGISGTIMWISLFEYLSRLLRANPVSHAISRAGRYTLGIYVLQTFILEVFLAIILKFDGKDLLFFNFVIAPIVSIGVLMLCLFIIHFIRRSRYLSTIILGEKLREKNHPQNESNKK